MMKKKTKEKMRLQRSQAEALGDGQDRLALGLVKVMKNALARLLAFLGAEVSLIQENLVGLLNGQRNLRPVRADSRRQRERQEKRKNNF